MLLIVAHHFVVNSGLNEPIYDNLTSKRSLFLLLFGAWGKIGINCFVLITGYFMCKSQITAKKFAKLFCEWMFYRLIIFLIFVVTGYQDFSIKIVIKELVPVTFVNNNYFTSCFIIFWLSIPFLNVLIQHLNEKQHIRLLLLSSFTYVFLGTLHTVTMNYVSWFIVIYFISSYIRIYPKKCFSNTLLWGISTVISVIIAAASVVCVATFGERLSISSAYFFVADSNTILAVLVGVSSFLFFKNIKIKYSRIINTIAGSTFGVLCIHANSDTMRQWLWKDTLDNVGHYNSPNMPLFAIGSVLMVFAICVIIDILRIYLVEKPFFKIWDRHWDKFNNWFQNKERVIFKKFNVE